MDKADFVVASFSVLEVQLIHCMEYIPFIEGNKDVMSPKFIPIIMDTCSLIDSVLREMTGNKNERYSLKKYSEAHERVLLLEGNLTLFLSSPLQLLEPYKNWTKEQPEWWAAYNMLKHDRLNNYKASTYRSAVLALAGLHQLMSRSKAFIGSFLRAGWIDTQPFEVVEQLGSVANLGALYPNPPDMLIESKLYVSPTGENFIDYVSVEDPRFFEVDYDARGLSNRVRNFLFAHDEW